MSQSWKFETKSVHSGYSPELTTKAVAVPIYQTAAYAFDSAQHGADLFDQRNNAANLVLQGEVERTAIAVVRILGGVVQPRPKFL